MEWNILGIETRQIIYLAQKVLKEKSLYIVGMYICKFVNIFIGGK